MADPALADDSGTVGIPGPTVVYPQDSLIGGANPYLPFGPNPMAPYGTWTPLIAHDIPFDASTPRRKPES